MTEILQSVVREPPQGADAVVIWLHGLGADGHDFEPIVTALALPADHRIRFLFPHAPVRPITINNGMMMRGWYDVRDLALDAEEDAGGIRNSAGLIEDLIDAQLDGGIAPARVVLAGFSQGGAIALQTGLRFTQPLAGLIVLSAYLPLAASLPSERAEANRDTPIFMGHGRDDPLVPEQLGERTAGYLGQLGYHLTYRTYAMQHAVCPEEIADIASWLKRLPGCS